MELQGQGHVSERSCLHVYCKLKEALKLSPFRTQSQELFLQYYFLGNIARHREKESLLGRIEVQEPLNFFLLLFLFFMRRRVR